MSSQDVRISPYFSATSAEKKKGTYAEKLAALSYNRDDRKSKFLCSTWCNNNLSDRNREIIYELFDRFTSVRGSKLCIFISDNYKLAHTLDLEPLLKVRNLTEFSIHGNYPYEINLTEWPEQLQVLQLSKNFVDPIDLANIYNFGVICGSPNFGSPRRGSQPRGSPNFSSYGSPNFSSYGSPLSTRQYRSDSCESLRSRSDSCESWRLRGSFDHLSQTSRTPSPDAIVTPTTGKYIIPHLR